MTPGIAKRLSWAGVLCLAVLAAGCAGREFAPNRGVLFYPPELPAADRAVENARAAGKARECPDDFKAAERMKNEAYATYLSCRTGEGIAKAKEAAAAAKGLCGKKAKAQAAPFQHTTRKVIDRLTLHINFDTDKADIRDSDLPELKMAIEFVKKHPDSVFSVEGHTDNRGTDDYNLQLSERRANAVKKYLVDNGHVKADRITAIGKGKAEPIGDNATEKGRFENRRVEILILGD